MNDQPTKPKPPPVRAAQPTPAQVATKPRPASRPTPRRLSPQEELEVLIRARYPVIYVVSWEEERVERCLREIAEKREKNLYVWTVTQGIVKSGVEPQQTKVGGGQYGRSVGRSGRCDSTSAAGDLPVQGFPPLHG